MTGTRDQDPASTTPPAPAAADGDPGATRAPPPCAAPEALEDSAGDNPFSMKGRTIGPYRISAQIGVGGMGAVYLADQTAPVRREVALKVIKAGFDSEELLSRFRAERELLARMSHPYIAQVLDWARPARAARTSPWSTCPACRSTNSATVAAPSSRSAWNCSCRSAKACSTRNRRA